MALPIDEYGNVGTPVNPYHLEADTDVLTPIIWIVIGVMVYFVMKR